MARKIMATPLAAQVQPEVGYDDALFVNPPSPSLGLHCPICHLILKEPHLLSCCGKHMCQCCLKRVTAVGPQTCPCCKSQGFQSMLNKEKQATIKGLTVRCMNKTKGCDWTGELGYSQEHLEKTCQYVEVPCQHGCGEKCLRSSITGHVRDQCINRSVEGKLESFMRQVTEKMAAQERKITVQQEKMNVQQREMAGYKREIAELKEQLKKHKSKEEKLESDAQRMKKQIESLESIVASIPQEEKIYLKRGVCGEFNLQRFLNSEWSRLLHEMSNSGVDVIQDNTFGCSINPFLHIKGERTAVARMKEKVLKLEASVPMKRLTIKHPDVVRYFYTDPRSNCTVKYAKVLQEIETQTETKIIINSSGDERTAGVEFYPFASYTNGNPQQYGIDLNSEVTMLIYGGSEHTVKQAENRILSLLDNITINEESMIVIFPSCHSAL